MNYDDIFKEIVNSVNTKHLYKWDNHQKEIAIKEFRRFLSLKIKYDDYQHILLSPGPVIDNIWHEFLLRPQDYYNYCMLVSGKIINHNPTIDNDVINRYKNTLYCYKKEFNENPPEYIWPPVKQPIKPSSTNKVVIYIIDKISDFKKTKTIKITAPEDVSYRTLINYIGKILKIPDGIRVGLIGKYGSYDRCFESETLSSDKKMKNFGMQNGSQYELISIPWNLGC